MKKRKNILLFILTTVFLAASTYILPGQSVKGKSMRMHTVHLGKKNPGSVQPPAGTLIAFVCLSSGDTSNSDSRTINDFVKSQDKFTSEILPTHDLARIKKQFKKYGIIWIHCTGKDALNENTTRREWLSTLKQYVESGGKLLLTGQAVHLLNPLGFESSPIEDSTKQCIDEGYGRRLGFHSFRNHPVFDGLNGGAYILWPLSDMTTVISGFFGERVPSNGKVVAVDWDYIFLREQTKLLFEYRPGSGKVLAVGGYINFSLPNRNRAHLERFTANCLRYLRDGTEKGRYWNFTASQVIPCDTIPGTVERPVNIRPAIAWSPDEAELTLKNQAGGKNFWDLAGKRLAIMGVEQGGIEEVWSHPFMAFRDYMAGLKFEDSDTIQWLSGLSPVVTVNPSCFKREYSGDWGKLTEIIVNDPEEPVGVIHYEYAGRHNPELVIHFKSNLRWMWPYSEKVTGSIYHWWDSDLQTMGIRDYSGDLNMIMGANRPALLHQVGRYHGFHQVNEADTFTGVATDRLQIAGLLKYDLRSQEPLDVIFCATSEGTDAAYRNYLRALDDPHRLFQKARQNSRRVLSENLMVTTPDPDFNLGYRWALLATDRFMVNTPELGEALVAGYATTRTGWDGGHKINGRPGYAWYFGRDAAWSGFALLGCGDFQKVKSQLEFFNKYQDLTGKIFHETSTSGFIHYDAADATPLYILLAGKYFRYSNDTAFLRKSWGNVKRALEFCFSTDTDRDHLIENTNVGHGWVEGGELYGSHATIYMAGIWSSALAEAAKMASFMNDPDAAKFVMESYTVKNLINNRFWSDQNRFFAYGMNPDRTLRFEPTALPAVPILLGVADRDKSGLCIQQYASNSFSTNWGVRIVRDDSKMYKPTGYHYGSVWPLFTGWVSLADYKSGFGMQGFTHLMNNLRVYKNWGLGFVEEVLNGAEYKPTGVCPHQCWSETMVLQPVAEGLLGLDVDAVARNLTFAPALPAHWDSIQVNQIRIGNQKINFNFKREVVRPLTADSSDVNKHGSESPVLDPFTNQRTEFTFTLDQGSPIFVKFMPTFPAGTRFTKITLDGREIQHSTFKTTQSMILIVGFDLESTSKLVVQTYGGIALLPATPDPIPGDSSEGLRIISSIYNGDEYQVVLEGKSSTSGVFDLWTRGRLVSIPKEVILLRQANDVSRFSVDFNPSDSKYSQKTIKFKYADY